MSQRYPHKNASTFNPFDQSSTSQKSIDDFERQKKKEMQDVYRDQLNNVDPISHQNSYGNADRKHWEVKETSSRNQNYRDVNSGGIFGHDDRASDELNKKKRLQQEILSANQKQIEQKEAQKRRDKDQQKEEDRRRVEDALYQHEQEARDKQNQQRRLVEQNDKQIQQQRREYNSRNNKIEPELTHPREYEQQHQRGQDSRGKVLNHYEQEHQYDNNHHQRHYERINQNVDYEKLGSGMENLNVKGKVYNNHQNSGNSMRGILQQSDENSYQQQQPVHGKGQAGQNRNGNSYNIISHN